MKALKAYKSTARGSTQDKNLKTMPDGHPLITQNETSNMLCPFAAMARDKTVEQEPFEVVSPMAQRPNSLPTPPETRERYVDEDEDPVEKKDSRLPLPSVTGSFSKCPIRMLDEKPPEEIAEYFETHKHEIPRSHEICVKRYQSNEHSIRLLDAKYGNSCQYDPRLRSKASTIVASQE